MNLRQLFILLTMSILLFSLTSCNKDKQEEKTITQTHIFYFTGSSLRLPFYQNISAAKDAIRAGHKGDNRVILFFQPTDRKTANIIELTFNNGLCEEEILASYELPAQLTVGDLSYYMREIIRLAPADHYSLVMAGHATAWIPIDPTSSQSATSPMKDIYKDNWQKVDSQEPTRFFGEQYSDGGSNAFEISELALALSSTGVKFEYIIFDACFMGNVEALYELRNNANYLIASPCEILNAGFPYDRCLPYMIMTNKGYSLEQVCKEYHDYYEEKKGYSGSVALIDCSQLEALAKSVKSINAGQSKEFCVVDLQTFEGQKQHTFFDLEDYIKAYSDDEELVGKFQKQLERTVKCKYTLDGFWSNYGVSGVYPITTFCGLTCSEPSVLYREDYTQTAWYKATH